MTATDELRRMLTEAGVEWKVPASYDGSTKYDTVVDDYWFHEYDGRITVHGLTPEQAIAATIGLQIVDKLQVFASCAYGIASEFMRLNGCPYYDNGMECNFSDECEEKDWAEQPDCLLDALAKALGIEVDE